MDNKGTHLHFALSDEAKETPKDIGEDRSELADTAGSTAILTDMVFLEDFGGKTTTELVECLLHCMRNKKMLNMRGKPYAFKIVSIYE